MLGLRPWLAFLRRTFAFFFWVRFDIGVRLYRRGYLGLHSPVGPYSGWPMSRETTSRRVGRTGVRRGV